MEKQAAAAEKLQGALFDEVYLPRFKQACADVGISFDSDEDLVAGLETCAMLKMAEAGLREQGIETRPSAKKQARDLLKQAMFGAEEQEAPASDNVKSALAELIAASTEEASE